MTERRYNAPELLEKANAEVVRLKLERRRISDQTQHYVELYAVYQTALEQIRSILENTSLDDVESLEQITDELDATGL